MTTALDNREADRFRAVGWTVLTAGWPDLLLYNERTRAMMAAEIKRPRDRITTEQLACLDALSTIGGIPSFVIESADEIIDYPGRVMPIVPWVPSPVGFDGAVRVEKVRRLVAGVPSWA